MEVDVPENMEEVQRELQRRQAAGEKVTENDVINQAVIEAFAAYLEQLEEGHYDSGKWAGDVIQITDVLGKPTGQIKPEGNSFAADFKKNSLQLFFYLQAQAAIVAKQN